MIFDEASISRLRLAVQGMLSDKRYVHTLGVEDMARELGSVLLPDKTNELRVAALLHDIAKEIPYGEQIAMLKSSDLQYCEEDIRTKAVIHSLAAIPVIKTTFSEYATPDVLSAVANHTLGSENMSVFDEIIYISDYAEAGRTYHTCKAVRQYLLENISSSNTYEQNVLVLHTASLSSVESTINALNERGESINSKTFLTKEFLLRMIK